VNTFWNLPSNGGNWRTKLNDLSRELRVKRMHDGPAF
jgi:hypothetical protein